MSEFHTAEADGAAAYCANVPAGENPYNTGSAASRDAWRRGWVRAASEALRDVLLEGEDAA